MKRSLVLPLLLCTLSLPAVTAADARGEIVAALDYYAELWNEGDFDALAAYYDPAFTLITDEGRLTLSQRMGDLRALAEAGGDRGELSHEGVVVELLGGEYAVAHGEFRLRFGDGSAIDRWFTTVYRKTPFGWKALLTRQ